jgi:hypothetical protein
MLDEQQKRLNLIQRLLQTTSPDVRAEIIKAEAEQLDETFFALFGRLMQAAMASGQQPTAQAMAALQDELMANSEYGRKIQAQMGELEAAVKSLQDLGQGLTREKLLDLFVAAPSEARLQALVSLTRNGLDYSFFQILTERIDQAAGEKRAQLEHLREKVLEYTNQIDKAVEEQMKQADEMIEALLAAPNVAEATMQNIQNFQSEVVVQILETKLREAQQKKDIARMDKLQQIVAVLQQASTPPELEIINELVDAAGDDISLAQALKAHENDLTEEMSGMIASLMQQVEQQGDQAPNSAEIIKRLEKVYRAILKLSMQKNLSK